MVNSVLNKVICTDTEGYCCISLGEIYLCEKVCKMESGEITRESVIRKHKIHKILGYYIYTINGEEIDYFKLTEFIKIFKFLAKYREDRIKEILI